MIILVVFVLKTNNVVFHVDIDKSGEGSW